MKQKFVFFMTMLFCILYADNVFSQQNYVKGTVEDESGPLPGVSVFVKNTTRGVETDFDGRYTIKVNRGEVLVFSFVGMKTVEKTIVSGKNIYNVVLESESEMIDEVVVTGITTTDRRLFTGASTKLKSADIKIEGLPDISRSLEGRAAGVSVQNVSGTFGAAPKIRIRGATSIYGSSKPLWVVDGIVVEDVVEISSDDLSSGDANTLISSAISGLNPDDIESFEVLKDGSATSIYGARAMAGVIVITTKKGKKGVSTVSYQGSSSLRLIPTYDNFNVMNSQEEMSVYQELDRGGWLTVSAVSNARESGVYGDLYRKLTTLDSKGNFLIENSEAGRSAFLRKAEYRNTNWFKELFNVNVLQSHSVSFSSGAEKSSYYGSLSAMVDPGWTKQSNVNRYTGNFNSSFDIWDNLKLNVISNASFRSQKAPGTLAQDVDVVTGQVKRDFDINPYSFAINSSRTLDPNAYYIRNYAPFKILEELNENYIDIKVADIRFQSELKLKVNSELDLSFLGALKYKTATQEHNITEFSNQANAYRAMPNTIIRDNNPFLYKDPDNEFALPISILPKGGILNQKENTMFGYDLRSTLSYKNKFERHIVNLYLGAELNSTDRAHSRNTNYGVQYGDGKVPFYDYRLFKKGIEENSYYYFLEDTRSRNLAFFANATYSWDRKYTINGTLRYEGTNKLGKAVSARWLPTWNVSGAWNVYEEDFFEHLKPALSNLTLKASYSLTADRGPRNVTNSLIDVRTTNPWRPFAGDKETSIYIRQLENSELTYEKKNELNLGLEAGFLNNRVNLVFDWYKRNNFDLIGPVYTQGAGGEVEKHGNVAAMKSNGFEISLATTNVKTKDFTWRSNFVYSKNENEVTKLESRKRVVDLVTKSGFGREGYPVRAIFSIPFAGLNEEGLPTFWNEKKERTVYDVYLQERDNVGFLEYSGSADPTDIGSFGNTFKYKNLSLNIFTTYSFGNVVRLEPVFSSKLSDFSSLPKEWSDRWVVPGDEKKTTVPVLPSKRTVNRIGTYDIATAYNLYNYSTERIAKGDFVRLKEISLSFDFPKQVVENLNIKRLSMKLQATNLFLLYSDDKLKGQDPEFFNSGGVATPVPKQFTFTLNLSI